jgi:hypothetical protein
MSTKRHAVIIGVNEYQDTSIPKLKGAENDAGDLYKRLSDQKLGEFEILDNHYLIGKKATCDAIRKSISDLLWKIDNVDLSLLYFSGHGFKDEYGNGYIAPWDIKREEPLVRGTRMQELLDLLLAAKQKQTIILILDCCYSGIATEGKGEMASGIEKRQLDQWFSSLNSDEKAMMDSTNKGKGRIIITATGKDEKSREKLDCIHTFSGENEIAHPHGAFTFHLLEGLDGRAVTGNNNVITMDGLIRYIEEQMEGNTDHKPTLYGASVNGLNRIDIAKAYNFNRITESINNVNKRIETNEPWEVFIAVYQFREIIAQYANVPNVLATKNRLDNILTSYKNQANSWLMANQFNQIGIQFKNEFKILFPHVRGLSVDTFNKQNSTIQSLLQSLCTLALNQTTDNQEQFLTCLNSYMSEQSQNSSVAKPGIQDQKVFISEGTNNEKA